MIDFATALRLRQDQFVETRTMIEQEVDKSLQSIANMDDDMKAACNYNPEYSAKTLLPALWQEPFDEDVYNQQLERLNNYLMAIKGICDKMDEEAIKCLQA